MKQYDIMLDMDPRPDCWMIICKTGKGKAWYQVDRVESWRTANAIVASLMQAELED